MTPDRHPGVSVSPTEALTVVDSAIRAACPTPLWLAGEIGQVSRPGPHIYLTLADEKTQIRVAAVGLDAQRVKGRLARAGVVLERGAAVRVYGHLRLHPAKGLVELRAVDIDTAVAVGAAEGERGGVLEVIRRVGLGERQRAMGTPIAPRRVGVIAPAGQGWADFEARLRMSPWAWDLRVLIAPSEGPHAPESIARAVREHSSQVDGVVVTRGGGAGVTTAYDTGVVASAICQAACPVMVAVGHHDDSPVAETVAWRREATPTAAAAVTLDRMIAAQRDDLAREMTAAVDDAARLLDGLARQLETLWAGFQGDVERLAYSRPVPVVATRKPGRQLNRSVAVIAALILAVLAVAVVLAPIHRSAVAVSV
jgi:exodeoxyribonuclease VII large subunit